MTIKLKRLELSNVRSHEHFLFEPEQEGITAIRGATGTGKSTVVDSLAFALYGTKPEGVSKASQIYRDQATYPDDKCFIKADLIVDDTIIRIHRRMVSKSGFECDVYEYNEENDEFEHKAGSSVSHSENYIRKRLKMNEKGFLSAIHVQQKQVDNLILAGARERAEVIEKLTGVSGITQSLSLARDELKGLKKAISLSTIDDKALEELNEEYAKIEETIEKYSNAVNRHEERLITEKEKRDELKERVSDYEDRKTNLDRIEYRLDVLNPNVESLKEQVEDLTNQRKDLKAEIAKIGSAGSFDEIKEQKDGKDTEVERLSHEQFELEKTIKNWEEELKNAQSEAKDKGYSKHSELKKDILHNSNELDELKSQLEDSEKRSIQIDVEIESAKGALEIINSGEGKCPTCLQDIHDADESRKSLENDLGKLQDEKKSIAESIKNGKTAKQKFETKLEELTRLYDLWSSVKGHKSQITDAKNNLKSVKSDIKIARSESSAIQKLYNSAEQAKSIKDDYSRVKSNLESAMDRLSKTQEEQQNLLQEQKKINVVKDSTLSQARSRLNDLVESIEKRQNKIYEVSSQLKVLEERLNSLEDKIENENKNVKRYQDLLTRSEEAAASVSIISEFRQERIDNAIPAIEAFASDLLSRFTEGKFVNVFIDAKFKVTVQLANGKNRPVGLLSGGELSAAAMALRLAISMMLNFGSSKNLLILDEVLVSQDAERAELILSTIKEVAEGQVLLIAHNASIDSVVDKMIEL